MPPDLHLRPLHLIDSISMELDSIPDPLLWREAKYMLRRNRDFYLPMPK